MCMQVEPLMLQLVHSWCLGLCGPEQRRQTAGALHLCQACPNLKQFLHCLFIYLFIDHNVRNPKVMTWNKKQNRTKENRKTKHSNSSSPHAPKRSTSCPPHPSPPG